MSNALTAPHFQNHEAAREWLEKRRWPEGPVCPHCGVIGHSYATKRAGIYRCAEAECRKDFSVTMNTVMERSHIPLNKWLMAFYLMSASKKGMSAHQLHRALGVTYKAAWFMCHRIREAMAGEPAFGGSKGPMGGSGKVVEVDETYFGKTEEPRVSPHRDGRPYKSKVRNNRPILSLVERGGSVRSFHIPVAGQYTVQELVKEHLAPETRLHTDESRLYNGMNAHFPHETIKHSAGEYARGDVTTNSVEGYFSIFKRGMKGTYQHCAEKHLHRYLAEFDFRYNHRVKLGCSDIDRTLAAIKGADGKRLMYRQAH